MIDRGMTAEEISLSPNQLAKRDVIVEAAVRVLLQHGVAGCTVRAIADEADISKGVVHYYFADVDEIVDRAMRTAVETWLKLLDSSAERSPGPRGVAGAAQFWDAMDACLRPFAEGDRTLMPLWFEYWTQCTRRNRLDSLRDVQHLLVDWVAHLLTAADIDQARPRAVAVTAYLFGVSMHQTVGPLEEPLVHHDLSLLSGIALPSS